MGGNIAVTYFVQAFLDIAVKSNLIIYQIEMVYSLSTNINHVSEQCYIYILYNEKLT